MEFIADLHVHSRHSAATSPEADLPNFYRWARLKGIQLLATGDFTHPGWMQELKDQLVPCGNGLFELKEDLRKEQDRLLTGFALPDHSIRFLLCSEISSIYKKTGKTRKIHNLVCFDTIEKAESYTRRLSKIGNIGYDGRPILGLDAKDLLAIVLETAPDAMFIPAHIWTPWFSLFGSKSGFNTVEECFEDLSPEITALETGLSSDPAMNWRVSGLDRYSLVSNSDAHSAPNLGREANLFNTDLTYVAVRSALKDPRSTGFKSTLEFFPEEGKYHNDGHRDCKVNISPEESQKNGNTCPVCKKPLTIGVLHRVFELADRPAGTKPEGVRPFESIVPLSIVVKEAFGSLSPPRLQETCLNIVKKAGPEFFLLRKADPDLLTSVGGPLFAEAVSRMRQGRFSVIPGYDGEFGVVGIFSEEERSALVHEQSLFADDPVPPRKPPGRTKKTSPVPPGNPATSLPEGPTEDPVQEEISCSEKYPAVILAGPGTGKTRVLVERVRRLLASGTVPPSTIACLTFTVKAARELKDRLGSTDVFCGTVHSFALNLLRLAGRDPKILDSAGQELAIKSLGLPGDAKKKLREWSLIRSRLLPEAYPEDINLASYLSWMEEHGCLDFDGLVAEAARLLATDDSARTAAAAKLTHVFVDEFQDINPVQYRLLAEAGRLADGRIFVIGDPDQSIYAFRGADPEVFARFSSDFPSAVRFSLTNNYRSSSRILSSAAALLSRSEPLIAARDRPGTVELCVLPSEQSEAVFAARAVSEAVGGRDMIESSRLSGAFPPSSLSSIAILARTERQLRIVADCLDKEGLPWKLRGGIRGLASESAKLMAHLMRFFVDPSDPVSNVYFASRPEVRTKLEKIRPGIRTAVEFTRTAAKEWNLSGLEEFFSLLSPDDTVESALEILRSPLEEAFETSRDELTQKAEAVSLLTLHASKGLEFGTVIILGLNDGILPWYHDPKALTEQDLAEERRLFYVGLTRASEHVILTRSAEDQPSRFLDPVRPESGKIRFRRKKDKDQLDLFPSERMKQGRKPGTAG